VRVFVAVAAVALFLVGAAWRFAGWILEWVGRLLGVRGLTSSYEVFVESSVGALMADGSLARILGPWFLMGIGLLLLAALYFPARQDPEPR